jgi:NADH-quinone oxidoreductase subunit C
MASSSVASKLVTTLESVFGKPLTEPKVFGDEVTVVARADGLVEFMRNLRDAPGLEFELMVDLCGVDYATYGVGYEGPRYAVVYHLLSLAHNQRLRVRVFCESDDLPRVPSVIEVWPAANWFEREAFDLFGIVFEGHPDLRRILTDYGFIGHPFRKDFPLSGTVEMRYDPDQRRVIYQPVTIEPRNNVPRIVREESYGDSEAPGGGPRG